jgi:hypothetical protein
MTLLDDRGRVAGRINLVDALVAVFLLGLVPLAYGAYLLFRTPAPKLVSVSPPRLIEGHDQRVEIDGTNLRPFMRVSFNATPAKSFLIGSTKYALIDVPDLAPGSYDLVLFDYMHEVDRLPKALTVLPMVTDVELEVVGTFRAPPETLAAHLKSGDAFPPTGSTVAGVVAVGAPAPGHLALRVGDETLHVPVSQLELPATLRVKCYTARRPDGAVQCQVPGPPGGGEPTVVAPGALLTLSSSLGWVSFQIASVHAPSPPSAPLAAVPPGADGANAPVSR